MLIKVWSALLVLVAATAFSLAIIAPQPNDRELARAHELRLDQSQNIADMLMRRSSRDWIDQAVRISQDRTLTESIEQANVNRFDAATVRGRVNARLNLLSQTLPTSDRPDLLIALDATGQQIGRIGPGAERLRREQGLHGYPLVTGALQGYLLDDVWSYDGRMYLVAGVPVIARDRATYAGALVVGRSIAEPFVKTLKEGLDKIDVAFFLRGKLLASTIASQDVARLPQVYAQPEQREVVARWQRTRGFTIGQGETALQVIMAPVRGSARTHDGFYALIGPPPPPTGLLAALEKSALSHLAFGAFPWITVGTAILLLLGLTWGLIYVLHDRPLNRLVSAGYRIVRGDATHVDDAPFRGQFFHIARAINEIAGRLGKPSIGSGPGAKARSTTQDKTPAPPARISDLTLDTRVPMIDAPGMDAAMMASLGGSFDDQSGGSAPALGDVGPFGRNAAFSDLPAPGATLSGFPRAEEEESPTGLHFGDSPADDAAGLPLLAPVSLPSENSRPSAPRPAPFSAPAMLSGFVLGGDDPAPDSATGRDNFSSLPEIPPLGDLGGRPAPQSLPDWSAGSIGHSAPNLGLPQLSPFSAAGQAPSLFDEPEPLVPPAPTPQTKTYPSLTGDGRFASTDAPRPSRGGKDEEAEHFAEVFEDFVATKRRCGEPTDNITLDRFVAKLKKNRASLVERYTCKAVRFQVYVKDGKAAVKATPVKD